MQTLEVEKAPESTPATLERNSGRRWRLATLSAVAMAGAFALAIMNPLGVHSAAAAEISLQVGNTVCKAKANNPHPTNSQAGQRIVNAKTTMGTCNGKFNSQVTNLTYSLVLQKCVHLSYGCLWSTVATSTNSILGGNTATSTRYVSKSCVDGHYRQKATVTIYGAGTHDSDVSYSQSTHVAC